MTTREIILEVIGCCSILASALLFLGFCWIATPEGKTHNHVHMITQKGAGQ